MGAFLKLKNTNEKHLSETYQDPQPPQAKQEYEQKSGKIRQNCSPKRKMHTCGPLFLLHVGVEVLKLKPDTIALFPSLQNVGEHPTIAMESVQLPYAVCSQRRHRFELHDFDHSAFC